MKSIAIIDNKYICVNIKIEIALKDKANIVNPIGKLNNKVKQVTSKDIIS